MPYEVPVNPYNEGTVLDSSPFTHYFMQQQAHKQAKAEAFNKYLDDQSKDLQTKGVRPKDVQNFHKKVSAWQDFVINNKDAIRKDPMKKMEADKLYQNAMSHAQTSVGAAEITKSQIAPLKSNPETWDRVNQSTYDDIAAHELPVDDPNFRQFDISNIKYNPKPFEWNKHIEEVTKGKKLSEGTPVLTPSKDDPLSDVVTTTSNYTKEDLQNMGEAAKYNYSQPKSSLKFDVDNNQIKRVIPQGEYNFDQKQGKFLDEYGREAKPTPEYLRLNDEFKKVYDRPMELHPNDHSDLAAAMTIDLANSKNTKTEIRENKDRAAKDMEAKQRRMAAYNSGLRIGEYNAKQGSQGDYLERHMADMDNAKNAASVNINRNGKWGTANVIPISPIEQKAFTYKDGNQEIQPDAVEKDNDGGYNLIVYKRTPVKKVNGVDEGGDIEKQNGVPVVETRLSHKITRKQAKANLAGVMFSGKIEQGELLSDKDSPQPTQSSDKKSINGF